MSDRYLYVGDHADTLASGRPIAPGERIPETALNLNEEDGAPDQRFIDDQLLVDDREIREQAKAEAEAAEKAKAAAEKEAKS